MILDMNERPFVSISGEAGIFPQGNVCTFLRLQGCSLRCVYCDTVRAQRQGEGEPYSIETLVRACSTKQVLITGGEPLLQRAGCIKLIEFLLLAGHCVQIETNGTMEIPVIPAMRVCGGWVIDRKGPSSGVETSTPRQIGADEFFKWDKVDVIFKYVVAPTHSQYYHLDRDFVADDMWEMHNMGYQGKFIISPMDADTKDFGNLFCFPREFQDRVIISLQIHKLLGVA